MPGWGCEVTCLKISFGCAHPSAVVTTSIVSMSMLWASDAEHKAVRYTGPSSPGVTCPGCQNTDLSDLALAPALQLGRRIRVMQMPDTPTRDGVPDSLARPKDLNTHSAESLVVSPAFGEAVVGAEAHQLCGERCCVLSSSLGD